MNKRLLPIGTVVTLKKNQFQKICLIGYVDPKQSETYKKYIGCPAMQGLKNDNYISFQENDIDNIYFMGYQTEEVLLFTETLKIAFDKLDN